MWVTFIWYIPHFTHLVYPTLYPFGISHTSPIWYIPHFTHLVYPTLYPFGISHTFPICYIPHFTHLVYPTLFPFGISHTLPIWYIPHFPNQLDVTDFIYENIDKSRLTGTVYVDLYKAFDTVDPSVLLRKLSWIGIKNTE